MTTNLMISMLRKGKTGDQILNILDAISGVDEEKETVIAAIMPSSSMILDWQGNEVTF